MDNSKDKIFKGLIWSFLVLYFCTASISFFHCIEFCNVGNPTFLSVIMSFAFEVGLALTLFSMLITEEGKNNVVSWILMSVLTCVQVMGNIYSVEKYMELSDNKFYVYIQNGFLHWFTDDMPERDVMSIIAIILGALLPIVALLMTSMVVKNWKNRQKEKELDLQKVNQSKIEEPKKVEVIEEPVKEEKVVVETPQETIEIEEPEINNVEDSSIVYSSAEKKESKLQELVGKAKALAESNDIIDIKPENSSSVKPLNFFNPINN